MVNCKR